MGVGVLFEHHYFRCFVKLVSFRVSPRCHPLFVSLALVHQPCESQIVIRDLPSPLHYFQVKTYESKLAEYGIPPEERSGQTRLPDVKVAAALRSLSLSQLLGEISEILTISWVCTDSQDFSTSHVLSVLSRLFETQSRT